jgi:hypothetical protein
MYRFTELVGVPYALAALLEKSFYGREDSLLVSRYADLTLLSEWTRDLEIGKAKVRRLYLAHFLYKELWFDCVMAALSSACVHLCPVYPTKKNKVFCYCPGWRLPPWHGSSYQQHLGHNQILSHQGLEGHEK